MNGTSTSIAQLTPLVEQLAGLWRRVAAQGACPDTPAPDLLSRDLEGRSLGRALADLWPGLALGPGPALTDRALAGIEATALETAEQAAAEQARRQDQMRDEVARLRGDWQEADQRHQMLAQAHSQTLPLVQRLQDALGQAGEELTRHQAQVQGLAQWLAQVVPHGLKRFRHPSQDRSFDQTFLEQSNARLARLWEQARADQERLNRLRQALQAACARRDQAALELEQDRLRLARLQQERAEGLARLRAQHQGIARAGESLTQARERLEEAQAARRLHQALLGQAGSRLRSLLTPPAQAPQALPGLEQALALAQAQGRRAERLAALARKAETALERLAQRSAPLGRQVREINRELDSREKELPALVAPLVGAQGAEAEVVSQVAGRLSLLLPRLEELEPRLNQAHAELEHIKSGLALNLERGKGFTEAWRLAAKAERSARDQAQALALEAGSLAKARRDQAQALVRAAQPLAALLARLPLIDLIPGLAAVAQRVESLLEQADRLERRAEGIMAGLGPAAARNLAQTPASWKAHAGLARRLGLRKLEPTRLQALLLSARSWQEQISRERTDAIRRPLQDVARILTQSLSLAAREDSRLRAARVRSARRLAGLRGDLEDRGRELAATIRALARSRDLAQERGGRIEALDADLAASRQEAQETKTEAARLLGELAASQTHLGLVQEQGRRQAAQIQDLAARLKASRQEGQEARGEIAALSAQARDLRQELGLTQEQLAQARSDYSRQNQVVARLERDLAQARAIHLADGEQARGRIAELGRQLAAEQRVVDLSRERLRRAARRQAGQSLSLREMEAKLSLARQGQAAAVELVARLTDLGLDHQFLQERLGESLRLNQALKLKAIERQRLLRQAQAALAPLEHWREEALRLQQEHRRLRLELNETKAQLRTAEQRLNAARVAKDQASARLASEQAARAQQALDLLQGQTLAVELAAAQGEAQRWAGLCQSLSQALAIMGAARPPETRELEGQVAALSAEVESLRRELAAMVADAAGGLPGPEGERPLRLPRAGDHTSQDLSRLAGLRARLKDLGRHTLGHWGLVAALTAGLSLLAPQTPSKATLQDSPQLPPRQEVRHLSHNLSLGQAINVPVKLELASLGPAPAELEINLLPSRAKSGPLPGSVARQAEAAARAAGLKPAVLLTSARAALGDQEVADISALSELAETARALAQRHPLIFRELSEEGLPKNAPELAAQTPTPEQGQHLYQDRLYREFRALGFSAEEALGACTANERAARKMRGSWHIPPRYKGLVTPVASVEAMGLTEFMTRITPYIQSRVDYFLRHQGGNFTGDTKTYAANLAYDIYCAAKKFDVPVSLMLVIANQETSYANVLGDSNRSASPFQIFEPTRRLIVASLERQGFIPPPKETALQRHLTMATYLAAFHVRELIQESIVTGQGQVAYVDTDRVMKRYNGSSVYASQVAQRQRQLTSFLGLTSG